MTKCLLVVEVGLDQCQVAALTPEFEIVHQEAAGLAVQRTQNEEWSFDAIQLWQQVVQALRAIIDRLQNVEIEGIALSSSVNGAVVWEKNTSTPIYAALSNKDKQAALICQQIKKHRKEAMIHFRTGLFAEPTLPGAQLSYILNQVESARERARQGELAFGSIVCWLLWQLTGGTVHAMDASGASQTGLFDLSTYRWETQLLAAYNVPAALMPRVGQSNDYYGETLPGLFASTLPIVTMTNRNAASLYALGLRDSTQLHCTFGHDLNIQVPRGFAPAIDQRMNTSLAWTLGGHGFFRLSARIPGLMPAAQWLNKLSGLSATWDALAAAAKEAKADSKVAMIPAFNGYGSPFFDQDVRGGWLGLESSTGQAELARALLDAQVLQVIAVMGIIEKVTKRSIKAIYTNTDKGNDPWLMHRQADLADRTVYNYQQQPLAWYGAAAMTWDKLLQQDALSVLKPKLDSMVEIIEPSMKNEARQQQRHRWSEAFERSKGWATL